MSNRTIMRAAATTRCASCPARKDGICCILDETSAALFAENSFRSRYDQGAEISAQGEDTDKVGVVASGLVKIVMITEDGDEYLLQVLHPGQIVGNPCRQNNAFSWEAATDAEVCWMTRSAFESFVQKRPQHYAAYLAAMASQLEDLQLLMLKMRGRNTMQRVACWLMEQAQGARGNENPVITIELTRRDLASLLDMSIETLCRGLHQLEDKGVITMHASDLIEVTNVPKLRVLGKCHDEAVSTALRDSVTATTCSLSTGPHMRPGKAQRRTEPARAVG